MSDAIRPFRVDVPDQSLVDLRRRLQQTRWPEAETAGGWRQGVPLSYLKGLCEYWANGYDWRRAEARLNAWPQFVTTIDGLDIHFLHIQSVHSNALPLIVTHGWPGSVFDFLDVIGPLTDPVAHGGDASDAFHLVLPSLPGYGFSGKPVHEGWNVQRIASAWAHLMARLDHHRYGAQGGDWGTSITTSLGQQDPEHVAGIHLNPPLVAPDRATFDDLTDLEQASLAALKHAEEWESGYSAEHSTKPQTIGYSLVDSPSGLCAWIAEKFWSWTDNDGDLTAVVSQDQLLDNITLYWLTATGASSARLYWESFKEISKWFSEGTHDTVSVPTGCSIFPKDIPHPSKRWAARRFTDIRYWNELDRGGHFAALEAPEAFVNEVRTFFRLVR
jgi:epoxide hydrolase